MLDLNSVCANCFIFTRELQDRFEEVLHTAPSVLIQGIVSGLCENGQIDISLKLAERKVGLDSDTGETSPEDELSRPAATKHSLSASWPRKWWKKANKLYLSERELFHSYSMFQSWS